MLPATWTLRAQWYERSSHEWGECGRVAFEDDEVLGFIKYAPPALPAAGAPLRSRTSDDDAVLLACLHIRDDARQHGLGSAAASGGAARSGRFAASSV